MFLILSGEGPSDIGINEIEDGRRVFRQGPMSVIVDLICNDLLGYSILNEIPDNIICISKSDLISKGREIKESKSPKRMILSGPKQAKGQMYFFHNARALSVIAQEHIENNNSPVVAVLFRDSDDCNGDKKSLWTEKFDSILRGFAFENFKYGVPMVPRPTSESWVLCCCKNVDDCSVFEGLSHSKKSPKYIKNVLLEALGGKFSIDKCCEAVSTSWGCPEGQSKLKTMSSFNAFYGVLVAAIRAASPN